MLLTYKHCFFGDLYLRIIMFFKKRLVLNVDILNIFLDSVIVIISV